MHLIRTNDSPGPLVPENQEFVECEYKFSKLKYITKITFYWYTIISLKIKHFDYSVQVDFKI